jgi:hypothetical protein
VSSRTRIRFRAKKHLSQMSSYHPIDEGNLPPQLKGEPRACDPDELIGVYENFPSQLDESVFILERGIIVYSTDSARVIDYHDISTFTTANTQGLASSIRNDMLVVTLTNGDKIQVPIRNDTGRFRDVFSFSMFLSAAMGAIRYFDQESLS